MVLQARNSAKKELFLESEKLVLYKKEISSFDKKSRVDGES